MIKKISFVEAVNNNYIVIFRKAMIRRKSVLMAAIMNTIANALCLVSTI